MFAFLFAVVSLTNIDPEAIVTPAPLVRSTANASNGFAPGDASLASGFSADIDVAPFCTFGMPRFGSDLWSDASALSRTLAPQCAGLTSPLGASGFAAYGFGAYGLPSFAVGLPWLAHPPGAVRLTEPTVVRSTVNVSNDLVRFPATRTTRALPEPGLQARPAEPALLRARPFDNAARRPSH